MTVAPARARAVEGGSGAHRSSQISTPTTRSGISGQAKRPRVLRDTAWPQSSKLKSTPAPEANHRAS